MNRMTRPGQLDCTTAESKQKQQQQQQQQP